MLWRLLGRSEWWMQAVSCNMCTQIFSVVTNIFCCRSTGIIFSFPLISTNTQQSLDTNNSPVQCSHSSLSPLRHRITLSFLITASLETSARGDEAHTTHLLFRKMSKMLEMTRSVWQSETKVRVCHSVTSCSVNICSCRHSRGYSLSRYCGYRVLS